MIMTGSFLQMEGSVSQILALPTSLIPRQRHLLFQHIHFMESVIVQLVGQAQAVLSKSPVTWHACHILRYKCLILTTLGVKQIAI